jgi:hypothetical protein
MRRAPEDHRAVVLEGSRVADPCRSDQAVDEPSRHRDRIGANAGGRQDDPKGVWGEPSPRFHDLSPDENYVLSTAEGGHFALWNVPYQSAWQPELPAHGGVHRAFFLPGGRAVLGTKLGGAIVIDCTPGITPADTPW